MKSCATPSCKRLYAVDRLLGGLMVPLCSTCATRVDSEAEDARAKRRARKTKTTPHR